MNVFRGLCPWLMEPLTSLEQAALAGRLGHGWLITGPRGTGKANFAYTLAERLLSGRSGSASPAIAGASETVAAYARLAEGIDLHPDLHRVWANNPAYKRDKAKEKTTIAVDQIRDVNADLSLKPHLAGAKVVIIEQAEAMTTGASNALLKSLEEPTPNTFLLLLSERPGRLPATIRSRCQHLALSSPDAQTSLQWLAADGLATDRLPAQALGKPPIVLAGLIIDEEILNNYIELLAEVEAIFKGRGDPHAVADRWQTGDTEMALTCLIENLQGRIRDRLAPGHSNRVTDTRSGLADNTHSITATHDLFAGLQMAENLRDQLGRGTNVELALKSLLLGLDKPGSQGVNA